MRRRSIGAPRQSHRPLSRPAIRRSPTPEKISKTSAASVVCRSLPPVGATAVQARPPKALGKLLWVGAIILVAVIAGALLMRRNSPRPEAPTPAATVVPEAAKPTEPPAAVPPPPSEEPAARKAAPSRGEPLPSPGSRQAAAAITLGTVQLCKTFSTSDGRWTCDPADDPAARGRIVLYTRVKSPRDATVVHRWYRGDDLHQSVSLSTHASMSEGYRTYSQLTINSPGTWRVEVRGADGDLLFEKSFAVR